jgi:plastocyanin domain-containing protein
MEHRISGTARLARTVAFALAISLLALALGGCSSPTASASGSPAAATGNVQHFDVSLASGVFQPNHLTAKAGAPVQITFGQGQGCTQTLVFPQFNINAEMTQGPQTFDLGALAPGEYAWTCGHGTQHGSLTVQ